MTILFGFMLKNKSAHLLFFFFAPLLYVSLSAQERMDVKQGLTILEQRYSVTFSYVDDDIKGLEMSIPDASLTVEEMVDELNKNPLLSFRIVARDQIALALKKRIALVCGVVVDAITRTPLEGASIYVSANKATITNAKGEFQVMDVNTDAVININYLGYVPQSLSIPKIFGTTKECAVILMDEKEFELNEVVVKDIFTSGLNQKKDGSVEISKDDFGILPGLVSPDVLRTAQVLPGVESVNELVSDINIRGGSDDQNLILWDNIKMYHSGHFFGLISAFNPEITNNVQITKNGTSAAFTDGVSGTINMKSDRWVGKKINGSTGVNLLSADAYIQLPVTDKLTLAIAGRRSITDFYRSPTYKKYFFRSFQGSTLNSASGSGMESDSNFLFYDLSARLTYDFSSKQKLSISLIKVKNDLSYAEFPAGQNEENSRQSSLSQQNLGVGTTIQSYWNSNFKTEFQTYFTNYDLEAMDRDLRNDQSLIQQNRVKEASLKLNTTLKLSDKFLWLNGYDYVETGILNSSDLKNPTYQIIQKKVNRNHGLYSEISFSHGRTYLRAGVRGNYFERFGTFLLEPRLSFNQNLSESISVKVLGEFKNQSTTQFIDRNEDFLGVENRRWVNSDNSTIPIIKSKQVSLGVAYIKNNLFVELNLYYKIVDDLVSESQAFTVQNQYDGSIGNSTTNGAEFLINKRFDKSNLWFSYTYNNQLYNFDSIAPKSFPGNFDVKHSLFAGMSQSITPAWKISFGVLGKSGRPYTAPVENQETYTDGNFTRVNYASPNKENLPAYLRLDLSSSYILTFKNFQSLSLNAGILNLLDKENIIDRYYEVSKEDETKAVQIDKVSLGFTPNLSLRYHF
ncbi:TonB-dependent receptor [Flavobacteriaceae bacterium F89]|uniref:TonB-dependent receptor n=1 Tax=Cerina litoralis TaxID=2874477 RepID=A0AAE3EYS1_9FLAO|nr:TonB-dependent receptor [Cerina litoralis]MCG2462829.1 TonB-dependent receptor [Cerina litoralis]